MTRKNILKIKKNAKKIFTPAFDIYYTQKKFSKPKIGFIISKRVCNKSTERNKIKRKIREFIRNRFTSGSFYVFLKKPSLEKIITELKNVTEKNIDFFNQNI